jgi:hypothetical protein
MLFASVRKVRDLRSCTFCFSALAVSFWLVDVDQCTGIRSGERIGLGRSNPMKVFLDFEASSLSDRSYPIEIAWVFENGRSESHLIARAPGWNDWDDVSESIHGISRAMLEAEGEPHDLVATRMVEALAGHDLFASAPSWDGKWLSVLLREAALPRNLLRLRDTDQAIRETVEEILRPVLSRDRLEIEIHDVVATAAASQGCQPQHRALADALGEYDIWLRARKAAREWKSDEGETRGATAPSGEGSD